VSRKDTLCGARFDIARRECAEKNGDAQLLDASRIEEPVAPGNGLSLANWQKGGQYR